jgi:hypothetical protein
MEAFVVVDDKYAVESPSFVVATMGAMTMFFRLQLMNVTHLQHYRTALAIRVS